MLNVIAITANKPSTPDITCVTKLNATSDQFEFFRTRIKSKIDSADGKQGGAAVNKRFRVAPGRKVNFIIEPPDQSIGHGLHVISTEAFEYDLADVCLIVPIGIFEVVQKLRGHHKNTPVVR